MPKISPIKKVWLYCFYTWVLIACISIAILISPLGYSVVEKAGPYLIPFIIFISVAVSWLFLKSSLLPKYLYYSYKSRFLSAIAGIMFILIGIDIYETGWINRYQLPVPNSVGIFAISLGVFAIFWGLFGKVDDPKGYYYCSRCKREYSKDHVKIEICPICSGSLRYETKVSDN